jgi:hypothetical protein
VERELAALRHDHGTAADGLRADSVRKARHRDPPARSGLSARARRSRLAWQLSLVAAIWSLGLLIAIVLPLYDAAVPSPDGATFVSETLVARQGGWVLIPAAIPLLLCGVVMLALRRSRAGAGARGRRIAWAAVGFLAAFGLFSILSIGGFVLPVALLLGGAVLLTPRAQA